MFYTYQTAPDSPSASGTPIKWSIDSTDQGVTFSGASVVSTHRDELAAGAWIDTTASVVPSLGLQVQVVTRRECVPAHNVGP